MAHEGDTFARLAVSPPAPLKRAREAGSECTPSVRVGVWVRVQMSWIVWGAIQFNWIETRSPAVLVLGGSVSAGGGVGNDPTRAWHAFLGDNVKPTLHFKSAIDPSYFLHCTRRFVVHDHYDAVLLDLGANMYHSACEESLVDLIARVRCLSKAPSMAVINWPGLVRTNGSAGAAWRARATLLEVPHGPELYSTDRVHPNARGHAEIAARVREYLALLPREPVYASDCPHVSEEACYPSATDMPVVRYPCEPRGWKLVDNSPPPHRGQRDNDAACLSWRNGEGHACYPSETDMPVVRYPCEPRDWQLVDDSPPPHLVHKYGWATTTPGASLTLAIPPSEACGVIVTLAYLASNFTGPFRVTCEAGCTCSRIRFYHQWRAFPFPVVTGHEDCIVGTMQGDCQTMKITRDTSFNLLRESMGIPCRVTVTALTRQRVRLDGLYVHGPSGDYLAHARTSQPSTKTQKQFAERALNRVCF